MRQRLFPTPQAAETAFYHAFEHKDAQAMMAVWARNEAIVCIHPMGPVLRGRTQVRESWEDIFRHAPPIRFRIEPVHAYEAPAEARHQGLAVRVVREHIQVAGEPGPRPPIYATNVYLHTERGWRMVLHHASPHPRASPEGGAAPQVVH